MNHRTTGLPVDADGHELGRYDRVICGSCGGEVFEVLGVGIYTPGEIYAMGEDGELVALQASMCRKLMDSHLKGVR